MLQDATRGKSPVEHYDPRMYVLWDHFSLLGILKLVLTFWELFRYIMTLNNHLVPLCNYNAKMLMKCKSPKKI